MFKLLLNLFLSFSLFICCSSGDGRVTTCKVMLELCQDSCVYTSSKHCAFTTITQYKGERYLAFREGESHRPQNKYAYGKITILKEVSGSWEKVGELSNPDMDLRDPFFIEVDGNLRLYCGYNQFYNNIYQHMGTVFSCKTQAGWSDFSPVIHDVPHVVWLWKIRKYKDVFYTVGYLEGQKPVLLSSDDGNNWKTVTNIHIEGIFSEADFCFIDDAIFICLRQDSPIGSPSLWIKGKFPFTDLEWIKMPRSIASPELICYHNTKQVWIAGREYIVEKSKVEFGLVSVYEVCVGNGLLKEIVSVEHSKGWDKGYPSFLMCNDSLLMSYYCGASPRQIHLATFKITNRFY